MARVFLSNETYNAATSGAQVFGAAGTEQVNVFSGTTGVSVASSVERVDLSGNIADYTFSSFGAAMTIRDTAGNIVATVSDSGGKSVVFADGALSAAYAGTTLSLGGVALTGTAAAITPAAADIDATTTSDAPASTGGTTGGAAQTFTLTASSPSVTEGDTGTKNLTFTLTLDEAPTEATIINYQALNSTTATAGDDFEIAAGIVTFAAGQTVATVSITVNGDTNFEGDETVQVQFSGGALEAAVTATGTITNDDADPAIGSQSFTLTTGPDGFSGTANSDLFIASDATLSSADVLDGAGGSDVLRYASSGTTGTNESGFSTTGIETAQVTADDTGGTTFDVTGMSGLTTIANNNSSANLSFTGLGSIAAVEMESVSGGNTTVTYKDAALSGLADAQTITLNGNANNAGIAASTLSIGDTSGDGLETLNIATTGAASLLADLVTGAATVNVTGDKNLSIGSTGVLLDGATTVNASAFTGNLSVVLDSNGTAKDVTVTGGAGDDTANFSAGFEADDVFTGGEGIDTLGLTNAIATGTPGGRTTDVEQLSISDAGTGTIDMDNFSGITKVIYDAGFAANATATVDDAVTGLEVELDVAQPVASDGSLVVDLKTDGTSDALTITLDDIGAGEGLALLSAEDAETLNISADDDTTGGTGTLTIASLTASDATTLNISGDAAVTITDVVDPTTPVLTTINAGTMTDSLTLSGVNLAAAGATVTLGSGDDTFTIATMAGADTFTLGAGKDTVVYATVAQSSGSKVDTITDFVSGTDVVNVTALLGGSPSSTNFVGNFSSFGTAQGALDGTTQSAVFQSDANTLWVDADGDGTLDAGDLQVVLTGVTSITAVDVGLAAGTQINLTAPAAVVNSVTKTNADNNSTNGNDTINASAAELVGSVLDGSAGTDTLNIEDAVTSAITLDAEIANIETVTLSAGSTAAVTIDDAAVVNVNVSANNSNVVLTNTTGVADVDFAGGAGTDTLTLEAGAAYDAASSFDGNGAGDVLSVLDGTSIRLATVSEFETLNLGDAANTTDVEMTVAQHNAFTNITGGGTADEIELFGGGTLTGNSSVEDYDASGASGTAVYDFTLGVATQLFTGDDGDDIVRIGGSTVGAIDGDGGTDTLFATTGADITSAANFEALNMTGTVTMLEAQHDAFNTGGLAAGGGTDQVTIESGAIASIITDPDVETYVIQNDTGDDGFSVAITRATQTITSSASVQAGDIATFTLQGINSFTGTITGEGTGDDILSLTDGQSVTGTVTGVEDLTLAAGATVTLTDAIYDAFDTVTAAGVETVQISDAASIQNDAAIENYTLQSTGNDAIEVDLANGGSTAFGVNIAAGGSDTVTIDNTSIGTDTAVVTVTGFNVADDEVRLEVANTGLSVAQFLSVTANGTDLEAAGVTAGAIIEISTGSLAGNFTADGDGEAIEAIIAAAIGDINVTDNDDIGVIVYGAAGAALYTMNVSDGDAGGGTANDLETGEFEIELVGILSGVSNDALTVSNFA
jgi:hypothetical protein